MSDDLDIERGWLAKDVRRAAERLRELNHEIKQDDDDTTEVVNACIAVEQDEVLKT